MADPKPKSIELPPSLTRILPAWITPMWTDAARWRSTVRNQPVAILCRDRLIAYAQALPWDIRAKDPAEQESLEPDIAYYRDFVLGEFDVLLDLIWQDALDLPIGGNIEVVRWPRGAQPAISDDGLTYRVTRPHPRGHPFKLIHIDGATLIPTYDPEIPMMQRVQGQASRAIFFAKNEIARVLLTPRTEMQLKGFGMPPPQRAFLALSLLFRGDQYYANMLLDTPEAGLLDLMDMTRESAEEWVSSYRTLMEGIDPFKIGVLYEHETAVKWIPFGRPPTDMMFDTITEKYARLTAAAYWLTLEDIGIEGQGGGTLAGTIRRQRETRLSGFGIIREKTKNLINNLLPPYLEFDWEEKDDEALSNIGRARLLNAQAMAAMVNSGLIKAAEGQQQLVKDGLLSIEVEPPALQATPPPPPQLAAGNGQPPAAEPGDTAAEEVERVPPSQGGRGDVGVTRGPDPAVSAVPRRSSLPDRLEMALLEEFGQLMARMGDPQLRKLIKFAVRRQFPLAAKTLPAIEPEELAEYAAQRVKAWFGEPSLFDETPDVLRADEEQLAAFAQLLDDDTWWQLSEAGLIERIAQILAAAYAEGAVEAAETAARFMYEEGLLSSPDLIGLNFSLKNPSTLAQLNTSAARMVRRVNDGTKFYLSRIIAAGVDEGLSSQEIAFRIQEGQDMEEILSQSNLVERVTRAVRKEVEALTDRRVQSIVNTEIARAETDGRLGQWEQLGLKRKRWVHTGPDTPCSICQANIEMGFVDIDFQYPSAFGEADASGPPAHPGVDHCHIEFDEKEMKRLAGNFKVWDGR